jgi:hypothetical protein
MLGAALAAIEGGVARCSKGGQAVCCPSRPDALTFALQAAINADSSSAVLASMSAGLGWPPKAQELRAGLPRHTSRGGAAECERLYVPPDFIWLRHAVAIIAEERNPGCEAVAYSDLPPTTAIEAGYFAGQPTDLHVTRDPWRDGPSEPGWEPAWAAIQTAMAELHRALATPTLGAFEMLRDGDTYPVAAIVVAQPG